MGAMQRNKGANYEREIARQLRAIFPNAERNVTETQHGQGIDLVNTGKLDIQCKRYRKPAAISKIHEVPKAEGRVAVLVTRGDRDESFAVLRLSDFIKILNDVGVVYND